MLIVTMFITVNKFRRVLIGSLLFFAFAHFVSVMLEFNNASSNVRFWTRLFDLDQEYNITSMYNWFLLALSGAFSAVLFMRKRSLWWAGLSLLFIYLSLDEALLIHEQLAEPLRRGLALTNASPFYHAWVIPAIIVALLLGIYLVIAAKRTQAVNFETNRIIYYVFLLAVGSIIIEIVGTRTYPNIVFYRFVTVLVEEMYEMSFSSYILYHIVLYLRPSIKAHSK
jgi:hypothetical protein